MPLSQQQIESVVDHVIQTTRDKIMPKLEPEADILPTVFIIGEDGEIADVAGLPLPPTYEGRCMFHDLLAKALKAYGAAGYVTLFMGWGLSMKDGEEWDGTPPSQSPNRVENLIVNAGSPIATVSRIYEAKRDPKGRLVELVGSDSRDAMAEGLFVDMLRDKGRAN